MKMLLWVLTLSVLVGGAAWSVQLAFGDTDADRQALTAAMTPPDALAPPDAVPVADCCRYVVKGCGKQANVCVPASCNSDAEKKARAAFEKKYACSSSSVSSYIGTCSNEKCDIDLR